MNCIPRHHIPKGSWRITTSSLQAFILGPSSILLAAFFSMNVMQSWIAKCWIDRKSVATIQSMEWSSFTLNCTILPMHQLHYWLMNCKLLLTINWNPMLVNTQSTFNFNKLLALHSIKFETHITPIVVDIKEVLYSIETAVTLWSLRDLLTFSQKVSETKENNLLHKQFVVALCLPSISLQQTAIICLSIV